MEGNGSYQKSKRGRSESISGRLRAASDLEEIGWIDKTQKGVIKDLIISGDETLRCALDKYENGDAHDLEGMTMEHIPICNPPHRISFCSLSFPCYLPQLSALSARLFCQINSL